MFIPALVPLACYEIYLKVSTGSWLAWMHAEQRGWQRQLTNPIDTFKTTWGAGFGQEFAAPINFVFQLEIFAVAAGVIATIALLVYRRWPEAIYVGLTILALATSIWYESVPRSLLLLWPIWCGLAVLAATESLDRVRLPGDFRSGQRGDRAAVHVRQLGRLMQVPGATGHDTCGAALCGHTRAPAKAGPHLSRIPTTYHGFPTNFVRICTSCHDGNP